MKIFALFMWFGMIPMSLFTFSEEPAITGIGISFAVMEWAIYLILTLIITFFAAIGSGGGGRSKYGGSGGGVLDDFGGGGDGGCD